MLPLITPSSLSCGLDELNYLLLGGEADLDPADDRRFRTGDRDLATGDRRRGDGDLDSEVYRFLARTGDLDLLGLSSETDLESLLRLLLLLSRRESSLSEELSLNSLESLSLSLDSYLPSTPCSLLHPFPRED